MRTAYRISPTNYLVLSDAEKAAALRSFVGVVRSAEKIRISIQNRDVSAAYAGNTYDYVERTVYFSSRQDIGPSLVGRGFKFARMDSDVDPGVAAERLSHLEMEGGTVARAYVVYDFARTIGPAWINGLASICSVLQVDVAPIRPNAARRMLVSHAHTLEAGGGSRRHEEAQEARHVNNMLQRQETTLYECGIACLVWGSDGAELQRRCQEFERGSRWLQIKTMAVRGKQLDTVRGWGPRFLFEEGGTAAFYPFESSDIMEADGAGGVYLGVNELTGAPVIYDYLRRTNYNMTILGSSGFGKSVAAKTYIDNFHAMISDKYGGADSRSYILDLHGEYVELAGRFGMDVVDLTKRSGLGLDPFRLLDTSDQAVDMLADAVSMPPELRSLAISRARGVRSISEMVARLQGEDGSDAEDCRRAATYLVQFVQGELSGVFSGNQSIGSHTIISMRKAAETDLNSMLISMALQRIWNEIRSAPRHVSKLLVIEEAWFMLRMPSTAAILSNIARSGRKENVHLIVMTQDIDEVLGNEHGAAVIKNSATVVLLGLKAATAKTLQGVLDLSDKERDEIIHLDRGQAMMRADNNRIKITVRPTESQLELFNTAASGFN